MRSLFKYRFKGVHCIRRDGINLATTLIALRKLATVFSVVTLLKYATLLLAIIGASWRALSLFHRSLRMIRIACTVFQWYAAFR